MLLVIDPGINQIGISIWTDESTLWYAGLLYAKSQGSDIERSEYVAKKLLRSLDTAGYNITELVLEDQIFRGRFAKAIMILKTVATILITRISDHYGLSPSSVKRYLPEGWKGNMGKQASEVHALRRLTAQEKSEISCPELSIPFRRRTASEKKDVSDVLDAVGIGLSHLGRW